MSVVYTCIGWNRHKRVYDLCLAASVVLFVTALCIVSIMMVNPSERSDPLVLLLRASGSSSIVLLHVTLCIGPLTRLDPRFLPLLYNRRHLGVTMFAIALTHAVLSVAYYHGFGTTNPLVSLLVNSTRGGVPFELFGAGAIAILFLMAATSHDYWLRNLGPRAWKSLHMSVYAAYLLLVAHIAFGALQGERGILAPYLLLIGVLTVGGLHLLAAVRESRADRAIHDATQWVDVCAVDEIPEKRARTACVGAGERIAIFRFDGKVSAVSNVCEHQHGPLGEGRIIGGCITCPWHGYQYLPESGRSPPPFTEKIATYQVRVLGRRVLVNPKPLPPGTPVGPAVFDPCHTANMGRP